MAGVTAVAALSAVFVNNATAPYNIPYKEDREVDERRQVYGRVPRMGVASEPVPVPAVPVPVPAGVPVPVPAVPVLEPAAVPAVPEPAAVPVPEPAAVPVLEPAAVPATAFGIADRPAPASGIFNFFRSSAPAAPTSAPAAPTSESSGWFDGLKNLFKSKPANNTGDDADDGTGDDADDGTGPAPLPVPLPAPLPAPLPEPSTESPAPLPAPSTESPVPSLESLSSAGENDLNEGSGWGPAPEAPTSMTYVPSQVPATSPPRPGATIYVKEEDLEGGTRCAHCNRRKKRTKRNKKI
jgi:hypothetical protein